MSTWPDVLTVTDRAQAQFPDRLSHHSVSTAVRVEVAGVRPADRAR